MHQCPTTPDQPVCDDECSADAPGPLKVRVQNFRPLPRNTLLGFLDVVVPDLGITILGVSLHQRDGRWWVAPPGRPEMGQNGVQLLRHDGQRRFAPIFEFANRLAHDRFSDAVVTALRATIPDALFPAAGDAARANAVQHDPEGLSDPIPPSGRAGRQPRLRRRRTAS